jgi:hypothetical protein
MNAGTAHGEATDARTATPRVIGARKSDRKRRAGYRSTAHPVAKVVAKMVAA